MSKQSLNWKNIIVLTVILTVFGLAIALITNYKPSPLRISANAIQEIMIACQGSFKDLSADEYFVYANCVDGKPVTTQNYLFK